MTGPKKLRMNDKTIKRYNTSLSKGSANVGRGESAKLGTSINQQRVHL
jgi:hypothetical protein